MSKIYLTLLLSLTVIYSIAQIPSGYYNTATGSGYTLKTQLHDIIDDHTDIGYSAVWSVYDESDIDPADGKIWDIYSEVPNPVGAVTDSNDPYNYTFGSDQCGNYSGEGSCYNREHSFPKSWFNDAGVPHDDVHHLYPTDGYVNGLRGNLPYGEVGSTDDKTPTMNGSKRGNARSGLGYSGTVFEPIDEYKGDLARTYFYMATRYEDVVSTWSSPMLDGSSDQVFADWALDMLLDWHNNDPVSQKEITRNNAIYDVQKNRNPFVDHPEFVNSIWGDCETPVTAPSGVTFANISDNSVTLSFTPGDGDARLVLMKEASAVDFDPVSGNSYTANADFSLAATVGTGNKVISASGINSLTITGLNAETTYFVEVFEYCSAGNLYLTASSASGSVTTSEAPPAPLTYDYQYLALNEIVMSTPGTDYEIIELSGIPGQSLEGLSIVTVDQFGEILIVIDLNGEVIPADGYWVAANSTAGQTIDEDFALLQGMDNNTTTFFLVENFSGNQGDDLDTNDDGILNSAPWEIIIDELGILERDNENIYSSVSFGPDGAFLPAGAYRSSDGCGAWTLHTFDTPPDDATPGLSNGSSCQTIYGEGNWTAGTPDASTLAIIAGDYTGGFTSEALVTLENSTLQIPDGDFVEVLGDFTFSGTLRMSSGATLLTGGTVSGSLGNVEIVRNTTFNETSGKYSFVSTPVNNTSVYELGNTVYRYDETIPYDPAGDQGLSRYVVPSVTKLEAGRGYASASTGTLIFNDAPNTGNIQVSLSKTDHSATNPDEEIYEGFNLVGNPYPGAIELDEFLTVNSAVIEGAVWLWDDDNTAGTRGTNADFITVNSLGAVSGGSRSGDWNGYIGMAQGFFVKVLETAAAGTYNLNFTNSMRSTGNNGDANFFRTEEEAGILQLTLSADDRSVYDETLIGFTQAATGEFDERYDAPKIFTGNDGIFTLLDEKPLAIQGLANETDKVIGIGVRLPEISGDYYIEMTQISGVSGEIYLKDHANGKLWDLKAGRYRFVESTYPAEARFSLILTDNIKEMLEEVYAPSFRITEKELISSGFENEKVAVSVFDISGKLISEGIASGEGQHVFAMNLKKETLYLVHYEDGLRAGTIKVIVR